MLAWSRCVSGRLFEPLRNQESGRNNEDGKQLGRDPTKPAAAFVTVRKRVDLRLQSTPITRSLLSRTADASGDGSLLGIVPFSGEGRPPMGEVIGTELDGRLFPDLSTLTPENPVTPADNFFIRTRTSKRLDPREGVDRSMALASRNGSSAGRSDTASLGFSGVAWGRARELKYDSLLAKNLCLWKTFHRPQARAGVSGITSGVRQAPEGSPSVFA
jgi:hypothetical protein